MKILFICTHNRCRSILAEAITNHIAGGKIQAASAGIQPAGEVHPWTLRYLRERGIPTADLHSTSWDELKDFQPDIVITVCDSAAQEACPIWLGQGVKAHWGLPDPSRLSGSDADIASAFHDLMATVEKRIRKVLALDFQAMTPSEQERALDKIAEQN
jgi:arsenate reductase (thioredoxin)